MTVRRLLVASALSALTALAASAQTPIGNAITYQGRLDEGGAPADGAYDFRFRLLDAEVGGAQVGTVQFADDLSITDGSFTAVIDFGETAFNSPNARWLEVGVRPGVSTGTYTILSPRQRITATPVALKSLSDRWSLNGIHITNTNTGNVGIGTTNPLGLLHLSRTSNPDLTLENTGDTTTARRAGLTMCHSNGAGARIEGIRPAAASQGMSLAFSTQAGAGAALERMRLTEDGRLGVGTTIPGAKLQVSADSAVQFERPITFRALGAYPATLGTTTEFIDMRGRELVAIQNNVYTTLHLQPDGGQVSVGPGIISDARLSVVRDMPAALFNSDLSEDDVVIADSGSAWLGLYSDNVGNVGSGITLGEAGTGAEPKWAIYARTSNNVGDLNITFGTSLSPTANEKILQLDRDGTTKVKVLEIMGADVSERFPMTECVEPGMVVMIDADNSGRLCLAHGEYNTKVAGVVSGAGDIPVGAILGNMNGLEDAPPIALSGRVWTWCDASEAAIEAGDLLTTSATPGHAMKAADADRRGGAIIGKAMTGLAKGEFGLVLVLVNLQ
jgi:hypothetical protein